MEQKRTKEISGNRQKENRKQKDKKTERQKDRGQKDKKIERQKDYGKIMRCALFEILYLTEVYLVTD